MRSSLAIVFAAVVAGCSSPVLVVEVQNPQALPIAHEHVTVDWTGAAGEQRTASHDFDINGNLGTFAVELSNVHGGRVRVNVDFSDATGAKVGRASATVPLGGDSRLDLTLRATRLLDGASASLLAGVPGGSGDRDGPTGPDPSLAGRLDRPVAFTSFGFNKAAGSIGLVLEECGAIKKIIAVAGSTLEIQPFLPCSRHTPPAATGKLSDLSLDDPVALVSDPFTGSIYIAAGSRVLRVDWPSLNADPATLTYYDFTQVAGVSPMHISDVVIGPYRAGDDTNAPPYSTLYVADDVANVVWALSLQGGPPAIVAGSPGPCPTLPLPDGERAHPAVSGTTWGPGPYIAPDQAHLCHPTRLETGAIGAVGSDPVLFVIDHGNGGGRMIAPNALGAGVPGITTLFDGYTNLQALGYRYLAPNTVLANTEIGGMFFWDHDQLQRFVVYMNPPVEGLGLTAPIGRGGVPGYTERFNMLNAISATAAGSSASVQFDSVMHTYRVSDVEQSDVVVQKSFFLFVQRGNAVVSRVDIDLNVGPWFGAGPHRGNDNAAVHPTEQPVFRRPLGLTWNGFSDVFVADRDNHAVARLVYDGTTLPLSGVKVEPLTGCPGTPGRVDGPAATALLRNPTQVAWDPAGAALYILDGDGTAVRKLMIDSTGAPSEIHTLFAADAADGQGCDADGGAQDGGLIPAGLLGTSSSLAFDPVRRRLWLAHADSPDLVSFSVDDPQSPQLSPLPAGSVGGAQLALVDAALWVADPGGHLSRVDLLVDTPTVTPVADLTLSGAVTAFGTDGEWLYLADDGPRVWRLDPHEPVPGVTPLFGDGQHGLLIGGHPGFNRVGGIGYDRARGVLLVSDSAENAVVAVQ